MNDNQQTTHFGFEEVPIKAKEKRVGEVFHSVAEKYDLMNDLMSFGLHRIWKDFATRICLLRPGMKVLDLAGGTGDLSTRIAPIIGDEGKIVLSDINSSMLTLGRSRLLDAGINKTLATVQANAEMLPFQANYFDRIIIGFGLRNVTDKDQALRSMYRCLKPGGKLIILEFSKPTAPGLKSIYDTYSFNLLPKLGEWIAKDSNSYRYLAESIRKHPDQATLKQMLEEAGFEDCMVYNLCGGITAVHSGYKY